MIKLLKILNVGIDKARREAMISLLAEEEKYLGKSFKISNNLPRVKELEDRFLSILSTRAFKAHSLWDGSNPALWIKLEQSILLPQINFLPGSHWSM